MFRAIGLLALLLIAAGCSQDKQRPAPAAPSPDAYALAEEQAFELGPVLAGVRACDGMAVHDKVFMEFMAAKRRQNLNGEQTAMIAGLVGAASALADAQMLECSAAATERRATLIDGMREHW